MTNVKNVKNGVYYEKVISEMKERCPTREEEFLFDITQTREKFKMCINICRKAAMKIKTKSGIQRFQKGKNYGTWFGKLMPYILSMHSCQPQQATSNIHLLQVVQMIIPKPLNERVLFRYMKLLKRIKSRLSIFFVV